MDRSGWEWARGQVDARTAIALSSDHRRARSVLKHVRAQCTSPAGRPRATQVTLSGHEPTRSRRFQHSRDAGPSGDFLPPEHDFDFDWRCWLVQLPDGVLNWILGVLNDDLEIAWCAVRCLVGSREP
eukprot:439985-Alexandrium_andersonii.AAC.1